MVTADIPAEIAGYHPNRHPHASEEMALDHQLGAQPRRLSVFRYADQAHKTYCFFGRCFGLRLLAATSSLQLFGFPRA